VPGLKATSALVQKKNSFILLVTLESKCNKPMLKMKPKAKVKKQYEFLLNKKIWGWWLVYVETEKFIT